MENELLHLIEKLGDEHKFKEQGETFLENTGTCLEVVKAVPQKTPLWCKEGEKHGIHYVCTLSNKRGKYQFDFWGCIYDTEILEMAKRLDGSGSPEFFKIKDFLGEDGKQFRPWLLGTKPMISAVEDKIAPKAYDILACLDPMYEDSFEDWCSSFGYDTDSRRAEKTYHACLEQDRGLRKIFTAEELEALSRIG